MTHLGTRVLTSGLVTKEHCENVLMLATSRGIAKNPKNASSVCVTTNIHIRVFFSVTNFMIFVDFSSNHIFVVTVPDWFTRNSEVGGSDAPKSR